MNSKDELLDGVENVLVPTKKLDFIYLVYTLLSISFACLLAFPKIYVQQQIYYKSRKIAKLNREYETLKEENRLISASVESVRFKNQILDTIF